MKQSKEDRMPRGRCLPGAGRNRQTEFQKLRALLDECIQPADWQVIIQTARDEARQGGRLGAVALKWLADVPPSQRREFRPRPGNSLANNLFPLDATEYMFYNKRTFTTVPNGLLFCALHIPITEYN
jgi:hypothetical protein